MDADEFRQRGREMVDFIADYLTNIRTRRVFPNVKPGYMRPMIDDEAPRQGEPWENIFNDIERVIMPGVCPTFFSLLFWEDIFFVGNTLAISVYACLFSGIEFLSIITWSNIEISGGGSFFRIFYV
jgi:hypothetical protein